MTIIKQQVLAFNLTWQSEINYSLYSFNIQQVIFLSDKLNNGILLSQEPKLARGIIKYKELNLPVVDLGLLINKQAILEPEAIIIAKLQQEQDSYYAWLVNSMIGFIELDLKRIKFLQNNKFLAGLTSINNQALGILNLEKLIQASLSANINMKV